MLNPYNVHGKLVVDFYDADNMFTLDDMYEEDVEDMLDTVAEGLEDFGIDIIDGTIEGTTKLVKSIRVYQMTMNYGEVDDHRYTYSDNDINRAIDSIFSQFDLKVVNVSFQ